MSTQFVHEDPHGEDNRPKRPRLVLACDNCRRKKSRCVQPSADGPCTACTAANIPCLFSDRERYYQDRMRNLLAPPGRRISPPSASSSTTATQTGVPSASGVLGTAGTGNSVDIPFFESDPQGRQRPHAQLMPALTQAFFNFMGNEYTFLSYDRVRQQCMSNTLSSMLANCIAALAVPFNGVPAFAGRDLYSISESYGYHAKTILQTKLCAGQCTPDMVQALILVAWIEYKAGRAQEFVRYTEMAVEMATFLGLSDPNTLLRMTQDRAVLAQLQATWTAVQRLQQTAATLRGTP